MKKQILLLDGLTIPPGMFSGSEFELVTNSTADKNSVALIFVKSSKVETDDFPNLLAVGRSGEGVNEITVSKATKNGIPVFYAPGENSRSVAELVFFVLGNFMRNLDKSIYYSNSLLETFDDDDKITKTMEAEKKRFIGTELGDKVLGIIGFGNIGQRVAIRSLAFEMRVIVYDAKLTPQQIHAINPNVEVAKTKNALITKVDICTVHVPFMSSTNNLIDEKLLGKAKQNLILINFSRKNVCDNSAVKKALDSGKLHHFFTDFPSKIFKGRPDVTCTSHIGGNTKEAQQRCSGSILKTVKDFYNFGIVRKSVNFPVVGNSPLPGVKTRVCFVTNTGVGALEEVLHLFSSKGIKITGNKGDDTDEIGYYCADFRRDIPDDLIDGVSQLPNIIWAQAMRF